MTSYYRYPEPGVAFAAQVRDETDRLVRLTENRGVGHGPCRERAIAEVLAGLMSVETARDDR